MSLIWLIAATETLLLNKATFWHFIGHCSTQCKLETALSLYLSLGRLCRVVCTVLHLVAAVAIRPWYNRSRLRFYLLMEDSGSQCRRICAIKYVFVFILEKCSLPHPYSVRDQILLILPPKYISHLFPYFLCHPLMQIISHLNYCIKLLSDLSVPTFASSNLFTTKLQEKRY